MHQHLKSNNKPEVWCSLEQIIEIMFSAIFPWWKLPYNAQRSIPRMIDEWFWKLQKSAGWLLVHEIWEICQLWHNCTISFGNSFNMCSWKRTKGFVTCLFNTFLHMGRLLSCFLTHRTFFTPGNAKLKSKFLEVYVLHTGFTLWDKSFIETNSRENQGPSLAESLDLTARLLAKWQVEERVFQCSQVDRGNTWKWKGSVTI